ncbi:hypothetical protein B0A55_06077 [Friedmanniomyces simplex]|uniref:Uncharacterized protein n=1 Tax=Friedmanniomyces simplex TaxID=329884 RepID=A0A4U0X9J8_9PEZI|nr:hypothetical protein B0A55_06077 [Friedmanniomyces simplex]
MFGGPPPPLSAEELRQQEALATQTVSGALAMCVMLYLSPFAVDYSIARRPKRWSIFAVVILDAARLDTSILRVNKKTNSEATDVMHAINTVTLDLLECCSKHGQVTLGSRRRGCGSGCVLDILTSIATIPNSQALHKLIVDMSNVSPEQHVDFRSLLENNKIAVQIGTGDEASEVWADHEPSEEEEEVNRYALQGGDLGSKWDGEE